MNEEALKMHEAKRVVVVEKGFKAFADMGLKSEILEGIESFGLSEPAEIQQLAIPHLLERKSLHIRHVSKSGKSLAIIIALLQLVDPTGPDFQITVLLRTREQVRQFADTMKKIASSMSGIHILDLHPGKMREFFKTTGHQILVCSVGRFQYILEMEGLFDSWELHAMGVNLSKLRCLVFDDIEYLGMEYKGLEELMGTISEKLPTDLQIVTACAFALPELEEATTKLKKPPILIVSGKFNRTDISPNTDPPNSPPALQMGHQLPVYVLAEEFKRDHLMQSDGYRFGAALDRKPPHEDVAEL
ncbi:P-loop containing nucleoside triphosphate hydrolase protein [Lindgomyces ingoldianus]|uniref:P-loop containing nucleoside triphosphate hydrolase protein n=1 Tax=Lindgomyces ingoldianus TaxID=673940 RepID=A0ACB6R6I1_9PLEO|nr:P-loop containing nucleoside triphosphate hydrolase protein [Lindgomyces ingoldianus]KAF2473930.1 P-loop containing nucleoside triphosphate hydrolase protein [Lindgomyces ingoldianus]